MSPSLSQVAAPRFAGSTPLPALRRSRSRPLPCVLAAALVFAALLPMAPSAQAQGPLSLSAPTRPPTSQRSGDAGMAEAERAAAQKRYDEAIQRYDRVIAANPRNVQARFERAWAIAQAGREDEAIRAFAEIAQEFPELPEPHNNLALLHAKRGDLKRAEAELLLALEARPSFAVGYTNLGDVYRRLAEQAYSDALKRDPRDARARSGLARVSPAQAGARKDAASAPASDDRPAATTVVPNTPPPAPDPWQRTPLSGVDDD